MPRLRTCIAPLFASALAASGYWRWRSPLTLGVLLFATALLGLALFAPRTFAPIQTMLERLGRLMATAVSWIILGLVFLLVFVPGRLFLLILHRDPIQRRPDPARTTYWEPLSPDLDPDRFKQQY